MLCEASSYRHVDMVRMLLDNGADVGPRSAFSKSILRGPALHVATTRGYTDIAQLLLERGADLKLKISHDRL